MKRIPVLNFRAPPKNPQLFLTRLTAKFVRKYIKFLFSTTLRSKNRNLCVQMISQNLILWTHLKSCFYAWLKRFTTRGHTPLVLGLNPVGRQSKLKFQQQTNVNDNIYIYISITISQRNNHGKVLSLLNFPLHTILVSV